MAEKVVLALFRAVRALVAIGFFLSWIALLASLFGLFKIHESSQYVLNFARAVGTTGGLFVAHYLLSSAIHAMHRKWYGGRHPALNGMWSI